MGLPNELFQFLSSRLHPTDFNTDKASLAVLVRNRSLYATGSAPDTRCLPLSQQVFPLLALPLDLLLHLRSLLPPSAQVALRLASRELYFSLPGPRLRSQRTGGIFGEKEAQMEVSGGSGVDGRGLDVEFMNECERRAIRFHFEEAVEQPLLPHCRSGEMEGKGEDICGQGKWTQGEQENKHRKGAKTQTKGRAKCRMRCALCKALYPITLFDRAGFVSLDVNIGDEQTCSSTRAECATTSTSISVDERPGVLNLRNRVCKWHDSRYQRTLKHGIKDGNGKRIAEGWKLEEACMHCGSVLSWDRCACDCQTCWKREVWTCTRVLEEEEERVREDFYLRWFF